MLGRVRPHNKLLCATMPPFGDKCVTYCQTADVGFLKN